MENERKSLFDLEKGFRASLIGASLVIIFAGMQSAQAILVPFLLSIFLATLCYSPMQWLQKKGVSTGISIVIVLLGIMAVLSGLSLILGSSINRFSSRLPIYEAQLARQKTELFTWFEAYGINFEDQGLDDIINPGAVMTLVRNIFASLGGLFSNAFLILFTVVFLLFESARFPIKLQAALDKRLAENASIHIQNVINKIKHYVTIKSGASLITGILVTFWLIFMEVDFPVLWGLLAFMLNFIPSIGSIIAAVPAMLMAVVQYGFGEALLVGVGYLVINTLMGSMIEPRVMGEGLGLSPLVVFVSLIFWGWVLGPVGMLLSVPLTMVVKIALDAKDSTRWLSVMMGSGSEAKADLEERDPPPSTENLIPSTSEA